jgi:hypothetical protein
MTPAERNRAEFPEFARIVDEIRAAGGTAKILWAANSTGYQVGPVLEGWDEVFNTPPVEVPRETRRAR